MVRYTVTGQESRQDSGQVVPLQLSAQLENSWKFLISDGNLRRASKVGKNKIGLEFVL